MVTSLLHTLQIWNDSSIRLHLILLQRFPLWIDEYFIVNLFILFAPFPGKRIRFRHRGRLLQVRQFKLRDALRDLLLLSHLLRPNDRIQILNRFRPGVQLSDTFLRLEKLISRHHHGCFVLAFELCTRSGNLRLP